MKLVRMRPAIVALAVAAAGGAAYGHEGGQSGSTGSTAQRPAETAQSGRSDARTFITEMAVAGMAEVQLGKMASERAADPDVKAFGQMMVKDHTKANSELKQVASQLKVQLPTQLDRKHRDIAERLGTLSGAEFDREYMTAMVQGHEEVAGKLRMHAGDRMTSGTGTLPSGGTPPTSGTPPTGAATTTGGSPATGTSSTGAGTVGTTGGGRGEQALTQWAAKTLPTVQQHLERARELQQKVAK